MDPQLALPRPPSGGPGRGSGRGVPGGRGPGGGPGPLVQACRVKLRRLRGPKKSKIWPIFAFLHLNRDPARPEGALLGLWRVLRTPWTPSGGLWRAPGTPLKRAFPGVLAKSALLGGSQGASSSLAWGTRAAPLGTRYIEGFNMYTWGWRSLFCSVGSLFKVPRLISPSPDY